MGLDMHLTRETYVKKWGHTPEDERFEVTVLRGGKPFDRIKPDRVSYVVEQMGCWRKANQIHAWFVKNVQEGVDNCQKAYVEPEKLKGLRKICQTVLDDPSKAGELLPPQSGFFFGGADIDEYYLDDLRHTIKVIDEALAEDEEGYSSLYYQSSW
jgi:hypothetical protein